MNVVRCLCGCGGTNVGDDGVHTPTTEDRLRRQRRIVTIRQGKEPCEMCCSPSDYFDEDGVPLCWACLRSLIEQDAVEARARGEVPHDFSMPHAFRPGEDMQCPPNCPFQM